MGNANGTSPLDNMRNLEHYLSDIMRTSADTPDHHMKGKSCEVITPCALLQCVFAPDFKPEGPTIWAESSSQAN